MFPQITALPDCLLLTVVSWPRSIREVPSNIVFWRTASRLRWRAGFPCNRPDPNRRATAARQSLIPAPSFVRVVITATGAAKEVGSFGNKQLLSTALFSRDSAAAANKHARLQSGHRRLGRYGAFCRESRGRPARSSGDEILTRRRPGS